MEEHDEEKRLRSVAVQNAKSILLARQRSEQALSRAKEAFQALVDQAPIGIVMVDAEMRIRHVNPTALSVFGTLDNLIGRDLREVVHSLWSRETAAKIMERFKHTWDTGEPYLVNGFSEERRDTKVREYYDCQIHRIGLPDGQRGVVCYFSDISAHVLARDALAGSEKRLRFMAETMPQKIFTAKPSGDIDYMNRQWTEFTGLSLEEILNWGWTQFIHPDDVDENIRRWQHSIDTGELFQLEHRFRGADGVYRWHLSRAHAMRDAEGNILLWTGSNTEIDDIKQAAEERKQLLESERFARTEAERTSQMKDEFLATLSHELRTPLSAILGWSHILRLGVRNEADLHTGIETIERNARMQVQLIEDLLDMSRITSGKMRLDIQTVEPISFIEAALETVRPAADAKGIRLEKLLDPAAGPISGDPNRLQQVIWNLVSNAIKFTPKDGKVQVLLERVNSHIEISVADTGLGIKPEFLAHVFERFRQANASTTRRYGGLGLGLSIVKHLVEMHGGTVRVTSPGENRGASFAVHLPLTVVHRNTYDEVRLHPKTPKGISVDFKAPDLSGVKVLVVDDEVDARDLIKRVLADCEAEVITAGTAGEALLLVERERPHVLVSDIGMPDIDGFELLRRVRALGQAKGGRVPAIALTAFARSEDRTRSLRAGFLIHISKPVEPYELAATVASVAGRAGEQM